MYWYRRTVTKPCIGIEELSQKELSLNHSDCEYFLTYLDYLSFGWKLLCLKFIPFQ